MKDIQPEIQITEEAAQNSPLEGPQGVGMAIAFDWGLTVQILTMPLIGYLMGVPGYLKIPNLNSTANMLVTTLISLPGAAICLLFGEGIRRGVKWTRPIQVVINALLSIGGLFSLYNLWKGSQQGNYWPSVTSVILLVFSPLITWRLSRPRSQKWFASVSSKDARKRHGGFWVVAISLWSIVGGVLQAIAALSR